MAAPAKILRAQNASLKRRVEQLEADAAKLPDRYVLGDAIRRSFLKRGKDSWCTIADDVLAEVFPLSKPNQ